MDGGVGCPPLGMYLILLNCILKMVKEVNCYYAYFTTIVKE